MTRSRRDVKESRGYNIRKVLDTIFQEEAFSHLKREASVFNQEEDVL